MPQHMVRQYYRHHGLCDGNAPNTDAGVVAAFGAHVDFIAFGVDAFDLGEHGGSWFNREARRDRITIGNPAKDAA